MTIGIIDVGTNSIHLVIGLLGLNGRFHVILKERDLTRLGEGGLARGTLTPRAMSRAVTVLQRYAAILSRCRVDHIEAVATSAVREARNGPAFVRRVRTRVGLPLRVISGREEARLIYLGVLRTHRLPHPTLILTIGGGSAQVMCGNGARLAYAASRPLGGARLAQQFIRHDPPLAGEVAALTAHLRRAWRPVALAVRRHRWRQALGSSATLQQLLLAAYIQDRRGLPKHKQELTVSRRALQRLTEWLAGSTAAQRIQLPGLDPRREDLALPTGLALLTWMDACRVSRLRYADGSLREGLIIDYLLRHHQRIRRIDNPLTELIGVNGGSRLPRRLRMPLLAAYRRGATTS